MLLLGTLACGDDKATAPKQDVVSFAALQAALTADCSACHSAQSGRTFQVTMDSAALVGSGLIDPTDPDQSLLILKPTTGAHAGGVVSAFSEQDVALAKAWIAKQPDIGNTVLTAVRLTGTLNVDGYKTDQIWWEAPTTLARIGGGWADATEVSMKAAYDDTYIYLLLQWYDDRGSIKRQPWVKKSDGTWAVAAAKPAPQDGTDWAAYKGAGFDEEGPSFLYEDKVALIWNTYGTTTVANFDQQGCAALCHDPAKNGQPGTTYNYATPELAAKKYTNSPTEIADMWHWKLARHNQHAKVDDQHVKYWQPGPTGAANGGRAGDSGTEGYATNPALNGRPTFRGKTMAPPPYYILQPDTVRLTDAELAALPAGTMLPNLITSGPTGARADIDGIGTYEPGMWTLEIRRKRVTGDDKDVQFDNLLREYTFGLAIFDNAQIEHSYTPTVYKLKFRTATSR